MFLLVVIFQNEMPDGGVGGRDVIMAVNFGHLFVECAAHDQPHDHFDTFRAGLAQVFKMRDLAGLDRVLRDVVKELAVPFGVDQASAFGL